MFETVGIMALNYGKQVATHPATRAAIFTAHTALMGAVTYQNAAETYRSGRETATVLKGFGRDVKNNFPRRKSTTFVADAQGMTEAA